MWRKAYKTLDYAGGIPIRGIRFEVPNERNKYLSKIFRNIDISKYCWNISEDEIYLPDDSYLFDSDSISGTEFSEKADREPYYIIFANLKAFRSSGKISLNIKSYKDFVSSDCQIVLLIYDVVFMEIYAKDLKIIEKIKANAERFDFNNIEYITDENDLRVKLSIQ